MAEATLDGTPILSANLDIGVEAGGYYLGDPSEPGGGAGPTAAEAIIENLFATWSAPLTVGDEWSSLMADDALFWDRDDNGYYDSLTIGGDGGVYVYNPETDSWDYRPYELSE